MGNPQDKAGYNFGQIAGDGIAGVGAFEDAFMQPLSLQNPYISQPQAPSDANFPIPPSKLPSNYYEQTRGVNPQTDPSFSIPPSTLPQDFYSTPSTPQADPRLDMSSFGAPQFAPQEAGPQLEVDPSGAPLTQGPVTDEQAEAEADSVKLDPEVQKNIDNAVVEAQKTLTPEDKQVVGTALSPKGTQFLAATPEKDVAQMPVIGQAMSDAFNNYRVYKDPSSDASSPCGQDNGDLYECPFTRQTCGRKSFFRRIVDAFKYIFGFSSQKAFNNTLTQEVRSTKAQNQVTGAAPELNVQAFKPQPQERFTTLQSLDPYTGVNVQPNLPQSSFTTLDSLQGSGMIPGLSGPISSEVQPTLPQNSFTRLSNLQ